MKQFRIFFHPNQKWDPKWFDAPLMRNKIDDLTEDGASIIVDADTKKEAQGIFKKLNGPRSKYIIDTIEKNVT